MRWEVDGTRWETEERWENRDCCHRHEGAFIPMCWGMVTSTDDDLSKCTCWKNEIKRMTLKELQEQERELMEALDNTRKQIERRNKRKGKR